VTQLQVNQFSHGLLNPGFGWLPYCLGSFIGLRCLTRARAYTGRARASWLLIASVAVGGTGIWAMHFVAMLGYTIPGQEILYNVPMTVISLVAAISVVAVGLFIVGFGGGGPGPVLAGGVIMGVGVAAMHYTGMDAMHVYAGGRMAMSGEPSSSLLLPLLLGASVVTFLLMLIIAVSPNEDEIRADASLSRRLRAGGSLAVRDRLRPAEITQPDVFEDVFEDVFGDVFAQADALADVPRE